jgi:dipeptidyl aminopeptidase/acylaminoacyl peptidase
MRYVFFVNLFLRGAAFVLIVTCEPAIAAAQTAPAPSARPANPANEEGLIEPEVAIQSGDYAAARREFHTSLVRRGPAPQPDSMPPAPEGVTVLEYPSGDLRLKAWINRPTERRAAQRPAVLFLHGGFSFGPLDWKMAQAFRDSGYVVMTPIFRGENRQPGAFTLFYDEVDDVLAAADALARQPYVDSENIYVAGHSNGGTLAMLAALASPRFRAAASFSGSPDQVIFCKYGFEGPVPFDSTSAAEYSMRSPLAYAAGFKCPTRIYYSTKEPHFHLSSVKTAALAAARGLDVEAIRIEGNHFSALKEERTQAIAFFRKHAR